MKTKVCVVLVALSTMSIFAQSDEETLIATDTLSPAYLNAKISAALQQIEDIKQRELTPQRKLDALNGARGIIVRNVHDLNNTFTQGADAIPTILSGIRCGMEISNLGNPFAVPTIQNTFEELSNHWYRFAPILAGAGVPLIYNYFATKPASTGFVSGAISLGVIATFPLDGILENLNKKKLSAKQNGAIASYEKAFNELSASIDVMAISNSIYKDVQELNRMIDLENSIDTTWRQKYRAFYLSKNWSDMQDPAMYEDPLFASYVDSSMPYIEKFTKQVLRMQFVITKANAIAGSYSGQLDLLEAKYGKEQVVIKECRSTVEKVKNGIGDLRSKWDNLSSGYYSISFTQSRNIYAMSELNKQAAELKVELSKANQSRSKVR